MSEEADPVFRLVFRALPDEVPTGRRLAGLLKVALRRFGFRCLEAVEVRPALPTEVNREDVRHDRHNRDRD